jgi:N-acetylglucosaminyldiphosphoundecaprenol N-acetyl-beta-D-mannosaminyltransferase
MRDPVQLRLTRVHPLTPDEAVEEICRAAARDAPYLVVTPNLSHLSMLQRDPAFRADYAQADLSLPDGWPVVRLVHLHGVTDAVRVTGSDLVAPLCREAARRGLSVGFVGGAADAAVIAADMVRREHPGLQVVLADPAPKGFDADEKSWQRWVAGLPAEWPQILFIGLGEPKQTRVALRLRDDPRARVMIGVGKAIEFTAGTAERAPDWWARHHVEWLHRALSEPRRLGPRYLQGLRDLGPMYLKERRAARRSR